jgi:hypothetical protein
VWRQYSKNRTLRRRTQAETETSATCVLTILELERLATRRVATRSAEQTASFVIMVDLVVVMVDVMSDCFVAGLCD